MLYRDILLKSLKTVWQNKFLWFFGLFAAIVSSSGGYQIVSKTLNAEQGLSLLGLEDFSTTGLFSGEILNNINVLIQQDLSSFIILSLIYLIILIISLFLIWVSTVSQVAIIKEGSKALIKEQKTESDKTEKYFQAGIESGRKKFWPVLGLNILVKIFIFAIFAALNYVLFLIAEKNIGFFPNTFYLLTFFISITMVLIFSFISKYAIAFAVLKDQSFFESIKDGFKTFYKNWLISLKLAFILLGADFLFSFILMLAILVLAIPFLFLALLFYKAFSTIGFGLIIVIGLLVSLGFSMASGAIFTAFQILAWTSLFLKLENGQGESKITRAIKTVKKTIKKKI